MHVTFLFQYMFCKLIQQTSLITFQGYSIRMINKSKYAFPNDHVCKYIVYYITECLMHLLLRIYACNRAFLLLNFSSCWLPDRQWFIVGGSIGLKWQPNYGWECAIWQNYWLTQSCKYLARRCHLIKRILTTLATRLQATQTTGAKLSPRVNKTQRGFMRILVY